MIDRIFHVVASTGDQVASLKLYEDVLGMTIMHGPFVAREGMSEAFAIPGETNTQDLGTFYRWGDDASATVLDTNLWMRPRYVGKAYPTVNNIGITRLGLKVADAQATYERLKSAGLEFVGEPVELSIGDGIRTCCFYNPERAVLQLVETGDHGPGEFDRIFSVCISVTDLDRSLPFYRDVLGFNEVTQFKAETNRTFPVGRGDSATLRGAWLRPGSDEKNTLIELVEWVDPKTTGEPYETVYNLGFPRVAFYVTDIQSEYERLREHVTFFSPPVITDLSGAKAGYNCFRDPDGTILQLYEDIPA